MIFCPFHNNNRTPAGDYIKRIMACSFALDVRLAKNLIEFVMAYI
jgi:hypothetical protein